MMDDEDWQSFPRFNSHTPALSCNCHPMRFSHLCIHSSLVWITQRSSLLVSTSVIYALDPCRGVRQLPDSNAVRPSPGGAAQNLCIRPWRFDSPSVRNRTSVRCGAAYAGQRRMPENVRSCIRPSDIWVAAFKIAFYCTWSSHVELVS